MPARWRNDAPPTPAGALAATMLSIAVASIAEPARLQRGRTYAKQNVVTRLEVSPGRVDALVVGSRPDPYEVRLEVPTTATPRLGSTVQRGDVVAIAPEGTELRTRCSCPDWDEPCKHVIAAMLVFADEVRNRPELLVQWRCSDDAPPMKAAVGSRRATEPTQPTAPPATDDDPFDTDEWADFFGTAMVLPDLPVFPTERVVVGQAMVGRADLGAIIADILNELGA